MPSFRGSRIYVDAPQGNFWVWPVLTGGHFFVSGGHGDGVRALSPVLLRQVDGADKVRRGGHGRAGTSLQDRGVPAPHQGHHQRVQAH